MEAAVSFPKVRPLAIICFPYPLLRLGEKNLILSLEGQRIIINSIKSPSSSHHQSDNLCYTNILVDSFWRLEFCMSEQNELTQHSRGLSGMFMMSSRCNTKVTEAKCILCRVPYQRPHLHRGLNSACVSSRSLPADCSCSFFLWEYPSFPDPA